jgi:hypothetical protein
VLRPLCRKTQNIAALRLPSCFCVSHHSALPFCFARAIATREDTRVATGLLLARFNYSIQVLRE